jgi:hypothetical protein
MQLVVVVDSRRLLTVSAQVILGMEHAPKPSDSGCQISANSLQRPAHASGAFRSIVVVLSGNAEANGSADGLVVVMDGRLSLSNV